MGDDRETQQQFDANLASWQKRYEEILRSDRAAVDLGVFLLKVVMTINAGGLLAVLASVDHLTGAPGAVSFFLGLMAAALAAFLAYFFQNFQTARLWNQFHIAFPTKGESPPFPWAGRWETRFIWAAIGLVFLSLAAFAVGVWFVIDSLQ